MDELTLYDLFAASVREHPEATAIELDGTALTYGELASVVDGVVARLAAVRPDPPRRVGLLAARSLGAYAGYLAALRLGATVVPLNTRYPAQRNAEICKVAGPSVVIVDAAGQAMIDEVNHGTEAFVLDLVGLSPDDPTPGTTAPATGAGGAASDEDCAYLLFTSGSTGKPKGVPVSHRNVRSYLDHVIDRYRLGPGCRLSHTFDLTFDLSVHDLFAAWGSGATMVVAGPDDLLDPVKYVNTHRITHWFSVPSAVAIAAHSGALQPNSMPGLRWSLFCGEQLTLDHARLWRRAAPASVIENLYGPTELTISCADYRLPADEGDWPATSNGTVPIGSLYAHLDYLVIDDDGHRAADGELCVRGAQRFSGYLNPLDDVGRFVEWNGERAVPHSGEIDAASWYRTGDRVAVRDGYLVHLGRIDHQIKISGYRVELGEIEATMRQHPQVVEAVAVPTATSHGQLELVGVYTGSPVPPRDLTAQLRVVLPSYMIPRRFQHVAALPLNDNGKVDRSQLARECAAVRAGANPRAG